MAYISQGASVSYRSDKRFEALITAWKLDDYIKALNGHTRDYFERVQELLYEIAAALDSNR